ncbi:unnamed protein product [Phytomonas sp. EM1]|nr:unnamed protein product [Phytomonas sp. EM1]|eukprot:CCW60070.1 unnamed protein product [Phytomonas sp. isolate EM1]
MSSKEAPLPPGLAQRIESLTIAHRKRQSSSASTLNDGSKSDCISSLIQEWREVGNLCFGNGSHLSAIRCYTNALQLAEGNAEECAILYCNRSAAYLKSTMCAGSSMALKDAEKVIALWPSWFKGHLRLADAHYMRKNYEEAEQAYKRALKIEPACTTAQTSLQSLRNDIEKRALEKQKKEKTMWNSYEKETCPGAYKQSGGSEKPYPECFGSKNSATSSMNSSTPRQSMKYESFFSMNTDATTDGGTLTSATDSDNTENLVRLWKRDVLLRDDRTGMKPRTVSLRDVDSSNGRAYKEELLSSFRSKVAGNAELSSKIRARIEDQHLRGQKVNYREADKYRNIYERSTNGIGLAITADAYKEFNGNREGYY